MVWLITGGAGYIGSHVVAAMQQVGHDVVAFDDLSTGHAERLAGVPLVVGSVGDRELLGRTMRERAVTGVVHLAAKKQVPESLASPLRYYRENVGGLGGLLEAMGDAAVSNLVFSSSAAVYGMPSCDLVDEDVPCVPTNPYGETKLIGEWMVRDVARARDLGYASLRYFNVAGAERDDLADIEASNLIPMVFQMLEAGRRPQIFGDDYDTEDGTCVRDFVHVSDVAQAHVSAARALASGQVRALTANIGTGTGLSVRQVVEHARAVVGCADAEWSEPEVLPRRPGDPDRVVASVDRIGQELGWCAQYGIVEMVESAWSGWRHHSASRGARRPS